MAGRRMKFLLVLFCPFLLSRGYAQSQTCPVNSNFSSGYLTHWEAFTGNNRDGNGPTSIKLIYDSTTVAPAGTRGAKTIYEYQLPSVAAIQVITRRGGIDPFGSFPTIPIINGYAYGYSVLLGSTAVSRGNAGNGGNGVEGGYTRGIRYNIKVPAGPPGEPYTMTYAYAMVLENGTHNSSNQPLFSATLKAHDSIITCASPSYYLPTSDNANTHGTGATLDTAEAVREGFSLSPMRSPNASPTGIGNLQDIWTKGWREVTFDLSPYRGQQVILSFESDNCIPGGHFAYAYIALRDNCAGLLISGDTVACANSSTVYSIPALGGGTYDWTFPPGWTVKAGGADSNIVNVLVGGQGGRIIVHEINGCADLRDTITVKTTPPTIAGELAGGVPVCTGENANVLLLNGHQGNILNWLSTTDGIDYQSLPVTGTRYTAVNLTTTTTFKAVVQNGPACNVDTSGGTTIRVDQLSVGGELGPSRYTLCKDQDKEAILSLSGQTGDILNWQLSGDGIAWNDFSPSDTAASYTLPVLTLPTRYRAIVKNGVCPADTSSIAFIDLVSALFPKAVTEPADTTICYGTAASLHAVINTGTNYSWSNPATLTNMGDGLVRYTPFLIDAEAAPLTTTLYVLSTLNEGCPNQRLDSMLVQVLSPILVNAGKDTAVVFNQPLQLSASSNTPDANQFLWSPATGLSDPNIPDPVGTYNAGTDSVRYLVKASDANGCYGQTSILVRVFKTAPDIFVPNAFTPGKSSNSLFRPVPVGIATLHYFRVYNRWGQLMYNTVRMGEGWDGSAGGRIQDGGTYVWMAEGTDYLGRIIARKGVMVMVR